MTAHEEIFSRATAPEGGVDPAKLDERQLIRELETVHRTRHETLLHGSRAALEAHDARTAELEGEYLRRHPERQVVRERTRDGARTREVR
jgi:hypothetical protein